jgi:SAM-dependent MidA family methyltransferase
MQRHTLLEHNLNVAWITSLDELGRIEGCVLSNELIDAFPVHVIEMGKEPKEMYVTIHRQELVEDKAAVSSNEIQKYIDWFEIPMLDGYRTEINVRMQSWLQKISSVLSHGFILTIDYGYTAREFYSADRSKGTLLCYHRHQVNENPFHNIGSQDITSHVNFSSLKIWGEEAGLRTCGYSSQGIYLTASGIDEIIVELYEGSPDYMREISKIKGLILPQGMGESHRVLIQYKGEGTPTLRGFSIRNEAGNL